MLHAAQHRRFPIAISGEKKEKHFHEKALYCYYLQVNKAFPRELNDSIVF